MGLENLKSNNQFARQYADAQNANSSAAFQSWLGGVRQNNNFQSGYASAAQANYKSPYEEINRAVDWSQKRTEGLTRLNSLLQENYEKTHQLEIQLKDGVAGAFTDAISSFISGTKSLGDVALDLLSNLSSKLLDLGLNSILGSASGGTGIFGSLLGGLFGGRTPNFGISPVSLPIPHFATGGMMQQDGLAYLHQGEQVLTPGQQRGAQQIVISPVTNIYNNAPGGNMSNEQANKFNREQLEMMKNVVNSQIIRHKRSGSL